MLILLFLKIEPNEFEAETLENVYLTDINRNDWSIHSHI